MPPPPAEGNSRYLDRAHADHASARIISAFATRTTPEHLPASMPSSAPR